RTPERGKRGRHARAVGAMAPRAVVDEESPAARRIARQRWHLREAFGANVLAIRHALRDVREVRDDVLHLTTVARQLGAGETAREAIIDAIFDGAPRPAAIEVPRNPRKGAGERRRVAAPSLVEMTARAIQIPADVRLEAVARLRDERQSAVDGRLERIIGRA